MVESKKIYLILCLAGILYGIFAAGLIGLGIYSLAIGCVVGVFFCNVGDDLRIYFILMVTSCNGEQSFSELKMVDWTKDHH